MEDVERPGWTVIIYREFIDVYVFARLIRKF